MKNNKGFTLVEILAVIIILGILMIIAIPSVTSYISGSRDSSYITTAQKFIEEAMNEVTSYEYSVSNKDYTYYIPTKCLDTQNDVYESPYGDFVKSYVVVTFDNGKNEYYYTGFDETGHGILLTYSNKLEESIIKTDLKSIDVTIGIGNREEIYLYSETCDKTRTKLTKTSSINDKAKKETVTTENSQGTYPEDPSVSGVPSNIVCIPVKDEANLHKKTCARNTTTVGCGQSIGYQNQITYGTVVSGNPKPGDAYDCKVTRDGGYTERFYYIGSDGSNSMLIYYTNMNDQTTYAYDLGNENWHGPRTAYQYLPSTSVWDNPGLISLPLRQIKSETGETTTKGGTIEKFAYLNKAARFLTYQEVQKVCGRTSITVAGDLDSCVFLLENVGYFEKSSGTRTYGYWLETPKSDLLRSIYSVNGSDKRIHYNNSNRTADYGVRPVITVLTKNLMK